MMKHPIKIGDCISLSEPCMGNIPPAPGVCYDIYQLDGRNGYGFIFPNGRYDGFSAREVKAFFDLSSRTNYSELSQYRFSNVIQLTRDFEQGFFSTAF